MSKITVLESAGFLGIRIERLLAHYGFDQTVVIKELINGNVRYAFKDSKVIMIDLDGRNINAVAIIEAIKKEPVTQHIPIIVLSSQSDIKTLKQAIRLGCDDFVTKPFSDELLIEKVHKLIHMDYKDLGLPTELSTDQPTNDTSFSWQKDYEIGVDEIDLEHKSIIDNYEKLYHYMITGKGHDYYDEMVQFLEKYVNEHFVHEELFQKSINYDQMAEHAEHHRLFKEKVFGIIANQKEKEVTNMDLVRINLFLKDWLLHHILVEDAKIGIFLGKKANH